jgi:hypothetical protein
MSVPTRIGRLGGGAAATAALLVILLANLPATEARRPSASLRVQWDPAAGAFVPIAPGAKTDADAALAAALDRSTAGLVEERQADGGIRVDLQGRFRAVSVATTDADGTVRTGCVTTAAEGDAFFTAPAGPEHGKER